MRDRFTDALAALSRRNRRRALVPRTGIDFASNDYLALSTDLALRNAAEQALRRGVPVGSGGSRLLRGNDPEHVALELAAARFFGAQQALYMGGGYVANVALFCVLPQRGDLIVYDELIHASAHDGMRAGRAKFIKVAHNEPSAFADAIRRWRTEGGTGTPWIAVESLYSMDGDRAPLNELMAIADVYDAMLLVDEAHATGVFGDQGRGLAAHLEGRDNLITLHTCGKALGCHGALICASAVICDFLINRARSFIYATAPSPLMAAIVAAALAILRTEPMRQERLLALIAFAHDELSRRGLKSCNYATGAEQPTDGGSKGMVAGNEAAPAGSQIIPILLGSDARALQVARAMQTQGFDLRAIRPPTVREGTARIRLAITAHVSEQEITDMSQALALELEANGR